MLLLSSLLYEVAAQLRKSIFLSMLMRVLWLINPTGAHSLRKIFDGINQAWAELVQAQPFFQDLIIQHLLVPTISIVATKKR